MSEKRKSANRKVTIIAGTGVIEAIDRLLRDRQKLEGLLAIGQNWEGKLYFYDSGGDIIEDAGMLEYVKERLLKDNFGKSDH